MCWECDLSADHSPSDFHIDDKRGQNIEEITHGFKWQANDYSCYTNCIYNILHELARAHNCTAIALSEQTINELCRSTNRFLGPRLGSVVSNMNAVLKKWEYVAAERSAQTHTDLVGTMTNPEYSFPIVGLSYDYLIDRQAVKVDEARNSPVDHCTIVLCSGEVETVIYDPFEGLSKKMQVQREEQGMPKGTYMIPTSRFLRYWEKASDPAWMFWVQHKPTGRASAKSPALESYAKP